MTVRRLSLLVLVSVCPALHATPLPDVFGIPVAPPPSSFKDILHSELRIPISEDAFGNCVLEQLADGIEMTYVYDGSSRMLARHPTLGTARYVDGPGIDEHLAVVVNGTPIRMVTDSLGSVRRHGNAGNLVTYNSFGQSILQGTDVLGVFAPGYTGRFEVLATRPASQSPFQRGSPFLDYRARVYMPWLGRFVTEDPLGVPNSGLNQFEYAVNNPQRFRDPFGLSPESSWSRYIKMRVLPGKLPNPFSGNLGPEPKTELAKRTALLLGSYAFWETGEALMYGGGATIQMAALGEFGASYATIATYLGAGTLGLGAGLAIGGPAVMYYYLYYKPSQLKKEE